MAHREGRKPFLDHTLTEHANSLPPSMKLRPTMKDNSHYKSPTENTKGCDYVENLIFREAARLFVKDEMNRNREQLYGAPLQYSVDGPLHRSMKRLITEESIADLGSLNWVPTSQVLASNRKSLGQMVDIAFAGKGKATFKLVICLAHWVVLRQRFGVQRVNAGLPEEAHV